MSLFDSIKTMDNLGYNHSYEDYDYQLELIRKAKTGDNQALEELIIINQGLILTIAKDNSYLVDDFDDLVQEGIEGFINAIYHFNVLSDTKFSTYASTAIRNKVSSYIQDNQKISIPRYKVQELNKYKKARAKLLQVLNREPTIEEIADYLDFTIDKTYELYNLITKAPVSLNALINGEDTELGDLQENIFAINPLDETNKKTFPTSIFSLLLTSNLTNKEIIVLILRNGINSSKLTLNEIGIIYGVTKERIRKIEENAIKKIHLNPNILCFLDYIDDVDYAKRKLSINQSIQNNPFSNIYPDFYSFFPEYTEEEIDDVLLNLPKDDLIFIKELNNLKKYNAQAKEKLLKIIIKIYDELFKKYKKRPLITPDYVFKNIRVKNPLNLSLENKERLKTIYQEINLLKISPSLREGHNLYDRFPKYTMEEVNRGLIYISSEECEFLQEKYGEDFLKKCNTENSKLSKSDIKKITEACLKIENVVERIRNNDPILSNIYTYFYMYSPDLIDIALNELYVGEIRLLHKRFSPDLRNPYPEYELTRLTKKELSKLNEIIKKLSIKLEELSKLMGKDYKKRTRRKLA